MRSHASELREITVVVFVRSELVGKGCESLQQSVRKESGVRIDILKEEIDGKTPFVVVGASLARALTNQSVSLPVERVARSLERKSMEEIAFE